MSYEQWQAQRRAAVTAATGNLALVSYQPVKSQPAPIEGLPATVALSADGDGVLVTADAADAVRVDSELVEGSVFVGRLRPDGTPIVTWDRYSIDVFSLDGSDYELRIYDAQAPNLENFDGIEYYDEDPTLAISGTFRPQESPELVQWDFTRSSDSGHHKKVPGVIDVTIDGKAYELMAFLDGSALVLVYADATTGAESYAPGKFLRMPMPEGSEVTVDFNRSFIPPCGFSDFYSCPIPPPQNRIEAPIRAGEKSVTWKRPRH